MMQLASDVKRHIHYYNAKNKAKLMAWAAYRADLLMATLGAYGYTFMTVIFINVLFQNIDSIAGWKEYEILLLLGVGQIVFYLQSGFFGTVDWRISEYIADGELDLFLLKPVNTLFNIVTYNFKVFEMLPSFMLAVSIFFYALIKGNYYPSFLLLFLAGVFTLLGAILVMLIKLDISLLSFWLTDTRDIRRIYFHVFDLFKYPLEIYPNSARFAFTTIIPVGLIAYFPAHLIIKGFHLTLFAYYLGSLAFFAVLAAIFWKKGLKAYSSASS